jgi:hypothetical protein
MTVVDIYLRVVGRPHAAKGERAMKNVGVPTVRRRATDAEMRRAIETDPECAELYRQALELAREYCKPKPEPEVLVKVIGPTAVKVRANPSEVFVGVREPNGVTTMERNPRHVTVLVDHVREVVDGRPVYPTAGAVHVYNPIDALKD